MKAVSNTPAVLKLLNRQPQTAKAIADQLGISDTAVRNTLTILQSHRQAQYVGRLGWTQPSKAEDVLIDLQNHFAQMTLRRLACAA